MKLSIELILFLLQIQSIIEVKYYITQKLSTEFTNVYVNKFRVVIPVKESSFVCSFYVHLQCTEKKT